MLIDLRRAGDLLWQESYAGWQTNRGLILADMGNYSAALEAHDMAVTTNPNVTVAWSNRAGVYEHLQRYASSAAFVLHDSQLRHREGGKRLFGTTRAVLTCSLHLLEMHICESVVKTGREHFG